MIKGDHSLPGTLLSFLPSAKGAHSWRGVKAVPRMDAEGWVGGWAAAGAARVSDRQG